MSERPTERADVAIVTTPQSVNLRVTSPKSEAELRAELNLPPCDCGEGINCPELILALLGAEGV